MIQPATLDLDRNAGAPLCAAARTAMAAALELGFGNPSSVHGRGQLGRALVERARAQVAALLDADPAEIVLTSGATEANVLAWRGVLAPGGQPVGRTRAVTTAIEHPSVLALARQLAGAGVEVAYVGVDDQGRLDLAAAEAALAAPGVRLLSCMAVNNELGVRQPLAALTGLARDRGVPVHTDATQAIGRLSFAPRAAGCDLASLSGHKFGAPQGTGALWVRRGVALQAVQPGHQEQGLRAGTENVLGLVGLGAAAAAVPERLAQSARIRALRDRLWQGLLATVPDVARNGAVAPDAETGQTLNVAFAGVDAPSLLMALDLEGICVSAGSACSSGTLEPSHVLLALGGADVRTRARSSLRFSLGPENTAAEIERVLAVLPGVVARVRGAGG